MKKQPDIILVLTLVFLASFVVTGVSHSDIELTSLLSAVFNG